MNRIKPFISLKYENVYVWRLDSLGCCGLRDESLFSKIDTDFSLKGKSIDYVVKLLGTPNSSTPKSNNEVSNLNYYFWSMCEYGEYSGNHEGEICLIFDKKDKLVSWLALSID